MNGLTAYGGTLFSGWQEIAHLGQWSMKQGEESETWIIHADVQWIDDYWESSSASKIVLDLGKISWTWSNVQYDGGKIIKVKGRPEEGIVDVSE